MFGRYCLVIERINGRRLDMSNHLHVMAGPSRAHGQAMCEDLRAADVARKILMCQVNDPQDDVRGRRAY